MKSFTQQLLTYREAIQGTRWTGGEEIWDTKSNTVFSSGKIRSSKEDGVAFIADASERANVLKFSPVTCSLALATCKTKFRNVPIVNAYAPREDTEEQTKEQFYYKLEQIYDSVPAKIQR